MGDFGFTSSIVTTSGLNFKGSWNANTNVPFLQSGVGTAGDYYIVSTAGTTNLDGTTDWNVGDWAVFVANSPDEWQKIDNHDIQAYTTVQNNGATLTQQSVIDFQGDGVTATNGLAKTVVTIPIQPAYSTIKEEGVALPQQKTINFTGSGVTASNSGSETVVNIPIQPAYATVQDEGTPLTQQPVIDFQGDGVAATNGSGKTIVTIPIQPAYSTIKEEGVALPQQKTINFTGSGVTASNSGSETVVNIPIQPAYATIQDEGTPLPQRSTIDFQGLGVQATDVGGKTVVTVLQGLPATAYGLYSQTADSIPVGGSTVEGSLIGTGVGTLSVPANGFFVGASFRADFGGVINTANNQTLRIRVKTSTGVLFLDSGVQALSNLNNSVWSLTINFTIRQTGAATVASIVSLGRFTYAKTANGTVEGFGFNTVNNTTFDTTIPNTLEVTAQFGSNNAGNSIYSDIFVLNKIY